MFVNNILSVMLFITYIYTLLYYDMVNNNWFINIDIM